MNSTLRPDELAKYAPRWLREGTAKPEGMDVSRAEEVPTYSADPPWRSPSPFYGDPSPSEFDDDASASPFDGDLRQWRTQSTDVVSAAVYDLGGELQTGIGEKIFKIAAIISGATLAVGALGLILFPTAPKETHASARPPLVAPAPPTAPVHPASGLAVVATNASDDAQNTTLVVKSTPALGVPVTKAPDSADSVQPSAAPQPATVFVATAAPTALPQTRSQPEPLQPQAVQQPAAVFVAAPAPTAPPRTQSQPEPLQPQAVPQLEHEAAMQGRPSLTPQRELGQRVVAPAEIDRLISRAETFLLQGDVVTARLLLQRGAEARDPRAALALGATYDPNILKRMGTVGIRPEPSQARTWYERASEYGSREASQRLTELVQLLR